MQDTVSAAVSVLNTVQANGDTLFTLETFKNVQGFYRESFEQLQSSFSYFAVYIGILIAILSILTAILLVINFKSVSGSKKGLKEELTKSKGEIEKWVGNQKDELRIKKEEIENTMINIKSNMDILFRDLAKNYYENAMEFFNKKDFLNYFLRLEIVYILLTKINLDNCDLLILNLSLHLIHNYKNKSVEPEDIKDSVNIFLTALSSFIKYCEDTGKIKHLNIAQQTRNSMCEFLKESL